MECNLISITGQTCVTRFKMIGNADRVEISNCRWNTRLGFQKLCKMSNESCFGMCPLRNLSLKAFCGPFSLETEFSTVTAAENISIHEESDSGEAESGPLSSYELKTLLADSERSKIIKKLSEANQQNRFLKRQMQVKEEALISFKTELAGIELEIEALVALAKEITKTGIPEGSRKINGKYIQSHLLIRLEAIQERLQEQLKDVAAAQSKEICLFWGGMAESVQVMGSFDGWSQGEHLSPEYTGSYTKFSTTLMLPPGRYEIKFLVDGEWQLSPELPTVGEGLMENNLLVVE